MTAEFAVVLPTGILILVFGIQVLAIQTGRIGMVTLAAEGARAMARGEGEELVSALLTERSPDLEFKVEYSELSVCIEISEVFRMAGFLDLPLNERACARKSGL